MNSVVLNIVVMAVTKIQAIVKNVKPISGEANAKTNASMTVVTNILVPETLD